MAAIASRRAERGGGEFLEMRGLGGERMGAGLRHLERDLVQVGRVEADHAGERLAVREAAVLLHQRIGGASPGPRYDSRARRCGGS